jgi:hypothetical protein
MTDAARSVIKGFNFQSAHTTLTRLERKWNMDSISASRSEYRTPTIDEFKAVANDLVIEALGDYLTSKLPTSRRMHDVVVSIDERGVWLQLVLQFEYASVR